MATLLALDGAEHGVVVAGTGPDVVVGSPAIVTSPVRTGLRAWELSPANNAESVGYNVVNQVCSMAFYVRFETLPTADVDIALFATAASSGRVWFRNATDQIGVSIFGGAVVVGGPTLVTGTWYRIVAEFDTSVDPWVIKCRVDNGTEFSQSAAGTAGTNQTVLRLGTQQTNQTGTYYCDDWLTSVTNGDYEEIGGWESHRVESLIPNADGSHNITTSDDFDSFTGTAFSNATTNGWTFIDHRPLQRANTADNVIRQELGTTANYMEFANENLSDNADPVDGVRTYATHIEAVTSGASLGEARLLLADNTEVLTTGSLSAINSTEDPGTTVTTRDRMTIAPAGGWDGTKVDGLKWRIGFADNAPDVNFIDLLVEVAQHVVSGNATATPATVAATAAIPAPTAQGAAQTAPATVASVAAVPTPTARSDNTASPATVAAVAAVPAPTVRGAASTSPVTVVATASVPAPTARGAAVTSPATVAAIGAVPAPVASGEGGGDATANPATVAAVAAIPASIARGAAIIGPATVGAVAAVPAPVARGAARTTPATVAALAAVPAPTARGAGQASPATVAAIVTVPAPTVRGAGRATPATVAAIALVPAPAVFGGAVGGPVPYAEAVDLTSIGAARGTGDEAKARDTTTVGVAG